MEFEWSAEQLELRSTVRALLDRHAPVAAARRLAEHGQRQDPELWRALAESGLTALAVPEEYGGAAGPDGAGAVELCIVAEEMGRRLTGGPYLSTAVLATAALRTAGDDDCNAEHLPAIADGTSTATLAVRTGGTPARVRDGRVTGDWTGVPDGADADLLLLVAAEPDGGPSLFAVRRDNPGVTTSALEVLDGTKGLATVTLTDVPAQRVGTPGSAGAVLDAVAVTAALFLAAEQAGACAQVVQVTAEYARTRRQFGRAVGQFQGVKHRLADMSVRSENAVSAAFHAAWQPPGSPEQRTGAAVAARYATVAFSQLSRDMIQLHGGIGFTWEHDAHLYLRRARADQQLLAVYGPPVSVLEDAMLVEAGA
ncbi:acyl-CoA dehydrogenase family protein [Nakamurella alba]|uniref:acyl-CoA dehydrogenase family protein n=1 Tax=Nakamurella alba TaxID=2665158 RepID=UPI002AC342A6|nr:acyl-CoA dehydrogenase family protein [Nakamurella alba]